MTLNLFDTYTRKIREFEPLDPDIVGMYACGPTVYAYPHIGNLRTYIFEDILRRDGYYAEQKDYFDAMREAARGAIGEGKSLREILQLSPEQFTHYSVPQFRERVLRTFYGELTGH